MGQPIDLGFHSPLELFAIAGAALMVLAVAADGESAWFEGLPLVSVYVILGTGFFFLVSE